MNRKLPGFALALVTIATVSSSADAGTYLRLQSWNARHMGWSGEQDWTGYASQIWTDFGSTASAANGCDVVALQEVMYDTSITSLVAALESISGVNWEAATTNAIGTSSYKERYSVVYRTDRITVTSNELYDDSSDLYEREPQIVKLSMNANGADFTLINWHTIYGSTAERRAEIEEIANLFAEVQSDSGSDQDVILLGDHNRWATSDWWDDLKTTSPAVSAQVDVATTINSSCNYASKYDHFWFQSSYVSEYSSSGIDYVANTCSFVSDLSDHAPIWIKLYTSGDDD